MTIFDTLRTVTQTQIRKYGTALELKKVTEGSYNTATGTITEAESTSYDFYGVLEAAREVMPGQKVSAAFSLESGDVLVTVPEGSLAVSIEPRDIIVLDSEEWRVIAVDPPYDDGTVVIRTVQIRRGTS
jgi:hypothetical protein